MEMEHGKLFVGGISWETNEERLRGYFESFGEVIEAIIMKDRITGRARGFGFVVFSDPAVAERVVREKHVIDGRAVEAKKAVPREDHQIFNRSSGGSAHSSPGPVRTKKIFVGGLASSVTETEFKNYFDQFGTITDVVVMHDHNTQRPRGFGFITYESEESVDKALLHTFHELNGKMVEVKRAVPKESSPGLSRNQISGFNYGLSRGGSLINYVLSQGYSSPSYGPRMDGRFSPISVGRSGYPPFSPSSYDMGLSSDSVLGINYGGMGNGNYSSNLGYTHLTNPAYNVASNRHADPFGYGLGGGTGSGNSSVLNSTNRNMWTNERQNLSNTLTTRNGFGGMGAIWSSFNGSQGGGVGGGGNASFIGSNLNYGNEESAVAYKRNKDGIATPYSHGVIDGGEVGGGDEESVVGYKSNGNNIGAAYSYGVIDNGEVRSNGNSIGAAYSYGVIDDGKVGGGSGGDGDGGGSFFYADPTWRASSPELKVSDFKDLFGYSLGNDASEGIPKKSVGYVGYSVANRSNRGIAA